MNNITKRKTRKLIPAMFAALIAMLMLVLGKGGAAAQGVEGTLTYTVAQGQQVVVWPTPNEGPIESAIGAINEGEYKTAASDVGNGWFRIEKGAQDWYVNMNSASVTSHQFTAGSTPEEADVPTPVPDTSPSVPTGNGSGHVSSSVIDNAVHLERFNRLPDIFQGWVLFGLFMAVVIVVVLCLFEPIVTRRGKVVWTFLIAAFVGLLWQVGYAVLVFFFGEWCLAGVVCVPDRIPTVIVGVLDAVILILGVVFMYVNGQGTTRKPSLADKENNKYIKEDSHTIDDTVEALIKDGWKPRGPIRDLVGDDVGKSDVQLYKPLDDAHHEGAPAVLFVFLKCLFVYIGGLLGQAFFSFLHFRSVTDFGAGMAVSTFPVLIMAVTALPLALVENFIENAKRGLVWLLWLLMWVVTFLFPFPPIFWWILFFVVANMLDGKFKNFWKGYSDMVYLTLILVTILTLGGWFGFWGAHGYLWLDPVTYQFSKLSPLGQLVW